MNGSGTHIHNELTSAPKQGGSPADVSSLELKILLPLKISKYVNVNLLMTVVSLRDGSKR